MSLDRIEVKIPTPDGQPRVVALRPPTDDEWLAHHRARKITLDRTGSIEQGSLSIDHDLVKLLILDGSAEVDEYEAALIVKTISRSDVDSLECEAGKFTIRVTVGGVASEHTLKIPTAKQLMQYQRLTSVQDAGRGRTRVSVDLQGAVAMYQALADAPPESSILAKFQAISAAMGEFQRLMSGEENF